MLLIDITLPVTPEMVQSARHPETKTPEGHIGTHFDVMDREFPLAYTKRPGIAFDVRGVLEREIERSDIDLSLIPSGGFVALYSGFIEREAYGSETYRKAHPQLSYRLIEALVSQGTSIIGIDFAGIRRGKEHTPADQFLADRGVFIVENLCFLGDVLRGYGSRLFTAYTFPMRFTGLTGLPCRVVAETAD